MKKIIFDLFLLAFLIITNFLSAQETNFKLCGDSTLIPYYFPELSYRPDFHEVKKYFSENYSAEKFKNAPNNTGMIHIVFWVNCKGETGNYSIETFDYDYKYCEMDENLKQFFLDLTKNLKVWKTIPENEKYLNFHKFYIFKVKNGELVEILPK
ncbi:MAG: hypothetical protein H6604_04835 [Flavobacteriales bacterium]|nr:hypothetical protein [Flavobacteriales bacterium]